MLGRITYRKVCQPEAPRSCDASTSEPATRRKRASTLLKTITTQNVAWPITIVRVPKVIQLTDSSASEIEVRRAIPVTMPGRAIGNTTRTEIASRPKNFVR